MKDVFFNAFIVLVGVLFIGLMAYLFYLGIFGKKFEDEQKKEAKPAKEKN